MPIFTDSQQNYLKNQGFDLFTNNEAVLDNGKYKVTIIKDGEDSFSYFVDYYNLSDIERANNNVTMVDLSWNDLNI